MASPPWEPVFDYEAENATGQYDYSYNNPTYLAAPQPSYAISGAASPVSASSPPAATADYIGENATYTYPTIPWDVSNPMASSAYSDHSTPATTFAGSSTLTSPSQASPRSTQTGSPTRSTVDGAYGGGSDPSSYQFSDRGQEFWSYYSYVATGNKGPHFRLSAGAQATEYYPRIIIHASDPSRPPESSSSSSSSHNGQRRYICLYSGCPGFFRRSADLERHIQQVHGTVPAGFYCDYRRCNRSDASPDNNPFGRKDHYRDHLREYHHEDLPKRDGNSGRRRDNNSARPVSGFYINPGWWRCIKCLARNRVSQTEWVCATSNCRSQCEADRQRARENMQTS